MSMLPGKKRAEHAQQRWRNDWYVEQPAEVHSLFDNIRFVGPIHDPACGAGNIPKIARARGHLASGSDLVDRGFGAGGLDYLFDDTPYWNIVTNPPYHKIKGPPHDRATEFALHALQHINLKLAMLVRVTFLCGQKRREILFKPHPPAVVLVLSKRPSMPPGGTDIPAKGGTIDYCWIVWDRDHDGTTQTKWAT